MSSGGSQDWYSISLISYHSIHQREGFRKAMSFISRSAALLFGARPHWGKCNPLTANELEQLYPELVKFKQVCLKLDSKDAFRNPWFAEILQSVENM
jgi:hypothetical protein